MMSQPQEQGENSSRRVEPVDRRRYIASIIGSLVAFLLLLFVPAGTLAWRSGWVFFGVLIPAGAIVAVYLQRVNPDVVAARVNRHEGTKTWDRWWLAGFLPMFVLILPVAAWDDARAHWSNVSLPVRIGGYALFFVGMFLITWAEAVNRFFEPTVRIQTDRGHTVVDSGPYAYVRHPGYVSAFLLMVGMALALGSYWALVPAGLAGCLLVVRTALEDRMLQTELPGYAEYAQRVRSRLIPGVW